MRRIPGVCVGGKKRTPGTRSVGQRIGSTVRQPAVTVTVVSHTLRQAERRRRAVLWWAVWTADYRGPGRCVWRSWGVGVRVLTIARGTRLSARPRAHRASPTRVRKLTALMHGSMGTGRPTRRFGPSRSVTTSDEKHSATCRIPQRSWSSARVPLTAKGFSIPEMLPAGGPIADQLRCGKPGLRRRSSATLLGRRSV